MICWGLGMGREFLRDEVKDGMVLNCFFGFFLGRGSADTLNRSSL